MSVERVEYVSNKEAQVLALAYLWAAVLMQLRDSDETKALIKLAWSCAAGSLPINVVSSR